MYSRLRVFFHVFLAVWIPICPSVCLASKAPAPKTFQHHQVELGSICPELTCSKFLKQNDEPVIVTAGSSVKAQLKGVLDKLSPDQQAELKRALRRLTNEDEGVGQSSFLSQLSLALKELFPNELSHPSVAMSCQGPEIAIVPVTGPVGVLVAVVVVVGAIVIGMIYMGGDGLAEKMWSLQNLIDGMKDWLWETTELMKDMVVRGGYTPQEMEALEDMANDIEASIQAYKDEMQALLDEAYPPEGGGN